MWLGPYHPRWGLELFRSVTRISSMPSQLTGAHVLVISQIHHCNASLWFFLGGASGGWGVLHRFQHVQNTAVRTVPSVVAWAYHCNQGEPHWLLVKCWIDFKIALMTYIFSAQFGAPVYLSILAESQLESIWCLLYWPFENIGLSHMEHVLSVAVSHLEFIPGWPPKH